jgi:glycosyltransferase involved in cell wall biosynthesis
VGVGDIHALTDKVKIILDDKLLRQKFQKNAKIISREMYKSDKIVPEYIEYYKRILEE